MTKKVNLQPLGDRVIVEPEAPEQKTASGLYIPDSAKEKPQAGIVVAVGPGKISDDGKTIPMNVQTGDKVLYAKYGGTEVKVDGNDYIILRETDILAKKI